MDPTDELNEADILFSDNNFLSSSNRHDNNLFPTPTANNARLFSRQFHNHHRNGILAGLLDGSASSMVLFSSGPSSPPPSKPIIPKPKEREFSSSQKFQQQSAPVKVPVLPIAMPNRRKSGGKFFEVEYDDEDDEMMPPHEIVARGCNTSSPRTTFSVLEGKGRTLKGRDLRQVRNAIWRQTGFLD